MEVPVQPSQSLGKMPGNQATLFSLLIPHRSSSAIPTSHLPHSLSLSLCPFLFFTQRLQKTRDIAREECLVATPGQMYDGEESGTSTSRTPRRTPGRAATPRRTPRAAATPGRTPGSRGRKTSETGVRGVKTGGGRRQLVRVAALRSPFASPNAQNQKL